MPSTDITAIRLAAVALAEYACNYEKGRDKLDPVYLEVTEGRDGPGPAQRKRYSSCGDLGHWILYRLGCRTTWVNRKEAPNGYRIGFNVTLLSSRGAIPSGKDWIPPEGAILVIANDSKNGYDSHVCVWLGDGRVANYGSGGMSEAISPGAKITKPALVWAGDHWRLGIKQIQRYIDAGRVALTATADLSGAQLTGDVIDAFTPA